ncbi:hypothetical protein M2360_005287 [Rhizobium sp. SG_E_25_P2]|uniref:hypothetical protein n=1 Tax=Rhizobium sp. SG_E_25_P2 TaxID=2879942 RepID=UPI002474DF5C|nr:hypothetical protein [Rhizobium sp. SG_E_25_P2]MDH6269855.1 hypothetical protein [Rhizobium sp. SG_E_25_P2]
MKRLFAVLAISLLSALSGCAKHLEWRQKISVMVQTPDGPKAASSVVSALMTNTLGMWVPPEGKGVTYKITGEAAVLELAPGKYLFALLNLPSAPSVFLPDAPREEAIAQIPSMIGQTRSLRPDQYPLLVTFADINDPASVRRVDPQNLAASFGAGYRLEAMTMTITDEPVTEGKVEAVLGWLGEYPEPKLSPATGRTTDIPFSRKVSHGDFIRR